MGYRGKLAEREQARVLRADGLTLAEIAQQLRVSKSSVSLWVRDVAFIPRARDDGSHRGRRRAPNALQRRKHDEVEALRREGAERVAALSEREFLVAGTALYAGEVTGIPRGQFGKAYRPAAHPSIRSSKRVHGCATVRYSSSTTHRAIMGLVEALPVAPRDPG